MKKPLRSTCEKRPSALSYDRSTISNLDSQSLAPTYFSPLLHEVSSALRCLTTLFGMGRGGSTALRHQRLWTQIWIKYFFEDRSLGRSPIGKKELTTQVVEGAGFEPATFCPRADALSGYATPRHNGWRRVFKKDIR